jgi:hypothetical protein
MTSSEFVERGNGHQWATGGRGAERRLKGAGRPCEGPGDGSSKVPGLRDQTVVAATGGGGRGATTLVLNEVKWQRGEERRKCLVSKSRVGCTYQPRAPYIRRFNHIYSLVT